MPNTFFVSDTHWGHSNVIWYSNRPFSSVEEMNEKLILNWNATVGPEDDVWHLGDFSFQSYPDFKRLLLRLNGKKHVCLGNHDKVIRKHKEDLLREELLSSVQDYAELTFGDTLLVLAHYSHRVWNKSHHGSIHLFGHSHGNLPPFGKSVDVGVDSKEITSEYRPVALEEVTSYMAKRAVMIVDHHSKDRSK